jgi:hypothetical protein
MLGRVVLAAALVVSFVPAAGAQDETEAIKAWLKGYDAAFAAKDLEKLATFYHADVTIFEGGGVNRGWADYRDNHLGPELRAFEGLQWNRESSLTSSRSAVIR